MEREAKLEEKGERGKKREKIREDGAQCTIPFSP